jgi:hypothetical protein
MLLTPSALLVSSPLGEIESAKGKKRTVEQDEEQVVDVSPVTKKACVDGVSIKATHYGWFDLLSLISPYIGYAIAIT